MTKSLLDENRGCLAPTFMDVADELLLCIAWLKKHVNGGAWNSSGGRLQWWRSTSFPRDLVRKKAIASDTRLCQATNSERFCGL